MLDRNMNLFFAFILIVMPSYLITAGKAKYLMENNINFRTVIIMNDGEKLIVDNDKRLIGKSKSYVFLYNKKNKFTRVIRRDQIKEEFIRQNPRAKWAFLFPF